MAGQDLRHFFLFALASAGLAGCVAGTSPDANLTADGQPVLDATVGAPTSVQLVDRDVEAPDVFQASGPALWDGRPSLGGVWVASPDAKDPERVIMRNPANGKFVIGALFRREADNPGPKLQISSDAADALGILAGNPETISVTALRREEAPAPKPDASAPLLDTAETVPTTDLTTGAAKAIDTAAPAGAAVTTPTDKTAPTAAAGTATTGKAAATATTAPATTTAAPPATTAAAPPATAAAPAVSTAPLTALAPAPTGALIQVGIFTVETNAQQAVDKLKKAGITATIRKGDAQGKAYWSVSTHGDAALLAKIKAAGFADAYLVKK